MTEQEYQSCTNKLPSRKTVLFALVVIAMAMTLVLVHMSGRWVGHRVFVGHQPRIFQPVVNSWEESPNSTGGSRLRSRGGRRKYKDWLIEKHTPPQQHLSGSDREESMATSIDFSPEDSVFDKTTSGDQQGLGLLPENYLGVTQSKQSSLSANIITRNPIQDLIRKATLKMPPEDLTERRKSLRRKEYQWNDLDPKAVAGLPFRRKGSREWKKEDALIFNRVGKCGSRTVIEILRKLAIMHKFNLISSTVYNQTAINLEWQAYIVQNLEKIETPYLFQRHLHFVDFTEFNARQPMYFNIIRDPLSRFVSQYYFKRFGDGKGDRNFRGSDEVKYRSVTDCIINGYKECVVAGVKYIVSFFCGQHKDCRKSSQWAVDRAKENVEKHFVMVGILEDLENSFRVAEKVLPQFFDGAVQLLLKPDEKQAVKNSSTTTKFKEKPSEEAATIMKRLMHYEYDFYYFVKDRLEKQKAYYGIGS